MLGIVYSSTLRDFLRPGRIVVWTLVALVVGLLTRMVVSVSHMQPDVAHGVAVSNVVFRFVALAAAIFSPMVVSQEVEQKTIVYWLTRAVPRPVMLVGRTLAAMTATAFVTVVVSVCVSLGATGRLGGMFFPDLMISLAGAIAYCSLFVMISLIVNKALVWCLLFAFGWETFVPGMPGMAGISFYTHLTNLMRDPKEAPNLDSLSSAMQSIWSFEASPQASWSVLLVSGVVLLGLASWWFSLKEFAPREDTD